MGPIPPRHSRGVNINDDPPSPPPPARHDPGRRRGLPAGRDPHAAGSCRGVQLQVRQQLAGDASAQHPHHRGRGARAREDRRQGRDQGVPQQPAGLRHRHAEPAALGRARVLHPLRPDPGDPGAGRLDQRRGLRLQGLQPGLADHGRRAGRAGAGRDRQARPLCLRQDVRQRLSPDHQRQQADQDAGRSLGLQDPRSGGSAVDQPVQGLRRLADLDQLQRGLHRAADPRGRRPGEPAVADRHGQALRSAEIRRHHQPHVGRLLVPGQQEVVRGDARQPARDRRGRVQRLRPRRARGPRQDEQHRRRHPEGQGHAVRRDRCGSLPRAC